MIHPCRDFLALISSPGRSVGGRAGEGGLTSSSVVSFPAIGTNARLLTPLLCSSGISKQKQSHNVSVAILPYLQTYPSSSPHFLFSSPLLPDRLSQARNHHQLPLDRPYIIPTLLGHWQLVKKDRSPIDDPHLGSPIQGRGFDLTTQTSV